VRYGGNTACVALEVAGEDPIVFDMGTGLRYWGLTLPTDGSFRGTALVTHIHWDHVQGLPFFTPIDRPGACFDVYGPAPGEGFTLRSAFDSFMRPPYFPVRAADLRGDIAFHELSDADVSIGNAKVRARAVPHCGATNGYRVDWDGVSVAYVSDHQSPMDRSFDVADSVLELCDGVDLLIHDAQFTPDEWEEKAHWGHCTIDYAIHVAREAGVKRLALFHHDPAHDDDTLDKLLEGARARAAEVGVPEVISAFEGLTVSFNR
jgi:phosphoribosyl 1,2-cyclic phosphodiesterase